MPAQVQPHPRPLGHLSLPITSYHASRAFYTAALAPLGLRLVYDSEDFPHSPPPVPTDGSPTKRRIRTLGYGPDASSEILNLFEYPPTPEPESESQAKEGRLGPVGFHVAFNAPSREAVVEFHRRAIAAGGRDNGPPGVREGYGRGYFAAFVVDPDGWRVEAVCKGDPSAGCDGDEKEGGRGLVGVEMRGKGRAVGLGGESWLGDIMG